MKINNVYLLREFMRKVEEHFKDHPDVEKISRVTFGYLSQTLREAELKGESMENIKNWESFNEDSKIEIPSFSDFDPSAESKRRFLLMNVRDSLRGVPLDKLYDIQKEIEEEITNYPKENHNDLEYQRLLARLDDVERKIEITIK